MRDDERFLRFLDGRRRRMASQDGARARGASPGPPGAAPGARRPALPRLARGWRRAGVSAGGAAAGVAAGVAAEALGWRLRGWRPRRRGAAGTTASSSAAEGMR